jgi:hypothetical protein
MATQFWVPGPAWIYVGPFGVVDPTGSSGYQFLGSSESGVQILLSPVNQDVTADYAAGMPADVAFLGEELSATTTLARYSESLLQQIMTWFPSTGVVKPPGGSPTSGAPVLGLLYLAQGATFTLIVTSAYANLNYFSAASSGGPMIPGFRALACYAASQIDQPLSIRVKKPTVTFRALPTWATSLLGYTVWNTNIPTIGGGGLPVPS